MALLDMYLNAPTNSPVSAGTARLKQAGLDAHGLDSTTSQGTGVDFMDAGNKLPGSADKFQSNFERRAINDTTVIQSSDTTTYSANDRKGLSRWFGRALNYAFTDPGAVGNYIQFSTWTRYKAISENDKWRDHTTFHRWTPSEKFNASSTLSEGAKTRATRKSAPTPSA